MTDQLIVGTIGRAHGLRGQVTVRPRTDSVAERFAPGAIVIAEGRELTVTGHSYVSGLLVVAFAELSDRNAAEALRGVDLWAEGLPDDIADDEFHDSALIGLAAVDAAGNRLGEVTGVQHNLAQDLLVLQTASGQRLVPFVTELVPHVDLDTGQVVIAPIPGLLDEVDDAN